VTHTYNPSYSGGRDQEDRGSKPTLDKQFARPCLKKSHYKEGPSGLASAVRMHLPRKPEALRLNPKALKKRKKRKKKVNCQVYSLVPESEELMTNSRISYKISGERGLA
jgi:hypothetical protein